MRGGGAKKSGKIFAAFFIGRYKFFIFAYSVICNENVKRILSRLTEEISLTIIMVNLVNYLKGDCNF